jgi:hypothetical protein
MSAKINILVFYWKGNDRPGWENIGLGIEYINKLYSGIKRNLSLPFDFYCVTNVTEVIPSLDKDITPLLLIPKSWKGCLPKLEAHNSSLQSGMSGRILVFDLDTVIVGDLSDICTFNESPFITRAWFKGIEDGLWLSGGDLLSFDVGVTNYLYDRYSIHPKSVEGWTGGRERYVYRGWAKDIDYWQRILPGQIVSYKRHMKMTRQISKNARLVSCHGNPRPHELLDQPWIQDNWKY